MRRMLVLLAVLTGILSPLHAAPPNVVLIMTDNHGAWTLGCYGNKDIRTPNIDRLASQGTLFERAFASNPVCSPTRATILTGLLPSQHGVHCFLVGGRLQTGPDARCTLDRFTSMPEILRDAGYDCGLVGKWHLGGNMRPQEGLDDYWITMPHGGTSTFYDAPIIEKEKIRREPQYLTDFWTRHAVNFIEAKAGGEKPFFLFLSYNGPYSLGRLLLKEGKNRHAAHYRDKQLDSFPREPIHPWQFSNRDYQNNPVSIQRVATEVSGVDDGVGAVMDALKKQGVDENTLVVFVADQGWSGGHGGFFGMGDHTRPVTARDEMMRIPMIWRYPKRIAPGRRSQRMVTNYDFLPTMLAQLDLKGRMPQQPPSPGRDFSPDLAVKATGDGADDDRAVFYEFENLRCVRTAHWKYVHRHPNGPHELFDLKTDPIEFNNLTANPAFAKKQRELKATLDKFYEKHALPEFDLWNGGGSQTRIFVGVDEEQAQLASVEPPPAPADFKPPEIKAPPGFSVELAAGPPLVTHPTMACLDDRGRLFVCNNAGLNMSAEDLEKNRPNSIRMLEDQDGDGRYDRSTVFADKMTFPMGGTWFEGALYVASPPNIWRLEDTDDDGVADKREVLVSRFGYTGNAASIHGCFFGPDGRLYWCDGYHGHQFTTDGAVTSQREGSYLFSCWPDGDDVRIHCGGGMDNPVEVDFTPQGDVIGTVNILYTRPRVDCLVHWQYGGAYPHRERVLSELKVTGPVLGPMHRFGHVAISGAARYRSGVLDHRWRNNFFATFFNTGKVVRLEMEPHGSTYRATQREFLSSDNRDFHPTDVLEDADGSLLVVDTGGWFYRGCPTSQLAKPDVPGAIYRVKRDGMTTLPDPGGRLIRWEERSPRQVVAAMNDTRHAVRERAIREAVKRGATVVPVLRQALERRDIRERIGAVRALTRLARSNHLAHTAARAALRLALTDRSQTVRQAACHAIAQNPDSQARPTLEKLLNEGAGPVRRTAAVALGRIGDAASATPLIRAAARASDREEEHAVTYALIEIDASEPVRKALRNPSPAARRVALIALDQMDSGEVGPEIAVQLLETDDPQLRQAAWSVFQRNVARRQAAKQDIDPWTDRAASLVNRWLRNPKQAANRADVLPGLVTLLASRADVADAIAGGLQSNEGSAESRRLLLRSLAASRSPTLQSSLVEPLRAALAAKDPADLELAIEAAASFRSAPFKPQLIQIGSDERIPTVTRVKALRAADGGGSALSEKTFTILLQLVSDGRSPAEVSGAAQVLSASALNAKQLIALAPALKTVGPLALRDLMRPYQRNPSPPVGQAFLAAVEQAKSLSSVPTVNLSEVVKRYPAELRDRANALMKRMDVQQQQRIARLDSLVAELKQGDAERGRALFYHEKSKCSTCHRVGKKGGATGPDLTTIGANRSPQDLLESIVFPSASIVRQYEPYRVVGTDGRVFAGVVVRESRDTVTLQQQVGDPLVIPRDEIEEMSQSTVSLMPKGVDETLTPREIADLVAWLRILKTR